MLKPPEGQSGILATFRVCKSFAVIHENTSSWVCLGPLE